MAVHGNSSRLAASSSIHKQNNSTPMYMRGAVPPTLPQQHQPAPPPPHYSYGNPTYGHVGYQPSGGGGVAAQHHVYTAQYTTSTAYWSTATAQHSRSDAMMYRHCRPHSAKRKSAVELLAETKPFYVKSDSVIEHLSMGYMGGELDGLDHQSLGRERKFASPAKLHQGVAKSMGGPPHMHHHHHHHGHHVHGRHANASGSLNSGNLKMGVALGGGGQLACNKLNKRGGKENERFCRGDMKHLAYEPGLRSQTQLPTTAIAYRNEPDESPSLLNVELPPTLSSLEDIYKLSDEHSGGEEPLVLTENYRPISPPAEYAAETISMGTEGQHRSSGRYQRSYSHSQEADIVAYAAAATYNNINSHKSLPDLHTHSNRQSPHSEILSCCSRGTSINRDSGGSSGHYTHRSEPCYQRQQREAAMATSAVGGDHHVGGYLRDMRRDSGSSTQHSEYISPPSYSGMQHGGSAGGDSMECHCKNPIQFEAAGNYEYFGNFPTPEVPKAFQDDYSATPKYPAYGQHHHQQSQQQQQQHHYHHTHGGGNFYYTNSVDTSHAPAPTPPSPQQLAPIDDISPPPIQFKRQRCIRFKNRQRIPLPGGANVATYQHPGDSMEYYHKQETTLPPLPPPPMQQQQQQHQQPQVFIFPKYLPTDSSTQIIRPDEHQHHQGAPTITTMSAPKEYDNDTEHMGQLERFFDRLGLNEAKFHEIYSLPKRKSTTSSGTGTSAGTHSDSDDSTVFFSDVSTVDSMRLPDSTETQPQATQPYRLSEPPSIVERNARIIKWLCNCKKMQYA